MFGINNDSQIEIKNNNSRSTDCSKICFCCLQKINETLNTFKFDENGEKRKKTLKYSQLKKEVVKRQKKFRNKKKAQDDFNIINLNIDENKKEEEKNKKVNQTLEDMCIYGTIMKEQIKEEKEANPEKFIEIEEALKLENEDQNMFALGLIANNLQQNGIEVAIEKDENDLDNDDNEDDAATTCLEFISSGMAQKKKYDLHFDFGTEKNEEYLNDEEKFEDLKEKLKEKLSKQYQISKDEIIVAFPQKGSLHVQLIFQSDRFNDLNLDEFKSQFINDEEFPELNNLKEIHSDVIMPGCKLRKKHLDSRGNRIEGWGVNEQRGNRPYNPPLGWIGIGLNVLDKYDNGDNTWIGMNNSKGEWCVAYHGVGRGNTSDQVKKITGLIINDTFKPGSGQVHSECDDQYHPGKKVGEGVYITPNISTAEGYSGKSNLNGKSYSTVLMVRVDPDAIRGCIDSGDYWVVNGTTDEIRPYRILYKES